MRGARGGRFRRKTLAPSTGRSPRPTATCRWGCCRAGLTAKTGFKQGGTGVSGERHEKGVFFDFAGNGGFPSVGIHQTAKTEGDNPHFWYDPDYVQQVINQITGDYQSLDPADAAYFSTQQTVLENALMPYRQLIQSIKQSYGGTQIGGTESIVVYMADALGLDLISPPDFMNAVSEGNDPPTQSVAAFEQQINQKTDLRINI